jgi:uncharacterized protein YqgV (UPF0045/DUF77 family)
MASVRIEFLVEPFEEGRPGPHVAASIEAARAPGREPEVGPFGTTVDVDPGDAGRVVASVVDAALSNGATRVTIQLDAVGTDTTRPDGATT